MSNSINKKINKLNGSRNRKLSKLHKTQYDTKYCDYIYYLDENGLPEEGYGLTFYGTKQYELDVSNVFKTALKIGKKPNGNK